MSSIEFKVIWLTLRVAVLCTLITVPIAIWLGWILTRKKIYGKPIIEAVISLPLIAPPVITGFIINFWQKWMDRQVVLRMVWD